MTTDERDRLVASVRLKFTSANDVPVDRAIVTRHELDALLSDDGNGLNCHALCVSAMEYEQDIKAEREACAEIVSRATARAAAVSPSAVRLCHEIRDTIRART